jgi:hypothetical protein
MGSGIERESTGPIQGQLLRLSERHAVAIYLRRDAIWIADFIDGEGVIVDANTWFRFNCGTLANAHALRRMKIESAMPLSTEFVKRIEALHDAESSRYKLDGVSKVSSDDKTADR